MKIMMHIGICALLIAALCGCTGSGSSGTATGVDAIVVDGDVSDWSGHKPVVRDQEGDNTRNLSGSDIVEVYIGRDERNLYARIDLANGTPSPELYFAITDANGSNKIGDRFVFVSIGKMTAKVNEMVEAGSHETVVDGKLAVTDGIIELSVPLAELGMSGETALRIHNDTSGDIIDMVSGWSVVF